MNRSVTCNRSDNHVRKIAGRIFFWLYLCCEYIEADTYIELIFRKVSNRSSSLQMYGKTYPGFTTHLHVYCPVHQEKQKYTDSKEII